ncbi:MAG: hypothetical protein KF742_09310, partial [Cryobacterium sp.]|nr:hypothetical protein [Cryobacterium sp.]
ERHQPHPLAALTSLPRLPGGIKGGGVSQKTCKTKTPRESGAFLLSALQQNRFKYQTAKRNCSRIVLFGAAPISGLPEIGK